MHKQVIRAPLPVLQSDGKVRFYSDGAIACRPADSTIPATASQAIASILPADLENPQPAVRRVTLSENVVFESHA